MYYTYHLSLYTLLYMLYTISQLSNLNFTQSGTRNARAHVARVPSSLELINQSQGRRNVDVKTRSKNFNFTFIIFTIVNIIIVVYNL